ncbi:TipAS antibiotic-recognition domain-containing protein [Rothia sp. SD9660Na]|uniref:TipAS antibiotic-recognition domain-containing protein n=1 Tax=Rothia sp. SD9660Na TaxID=3047030 RepID=UPI0024B9DEED|nr:TipAS antibiotic-recognition domain-containing protein [Rothia sp. SD9660Na]WHS49548.1 TipAS antibiotic-recognition domain-containing protein [Rothia sp. SD9660Na]
MRRSLPIDSTEAGELVRAHRQLLSEFFPVTPAKHYLISRGYVTDERFTSYYESQQPGLAQWLADAIEAESQRVGVDLANPTWD